MIYLLNTKAYTWLLKKAARHETLARYYRTAAHTWRTLWDGQQSHK